MRNITWLASYPKSGNTWLRVFLTNLELGGDEQGGRGLRLEDLSGQSGRRPLPVGLVVLTGFRPGRRCRPRALSQGQAVLALLSHTVPARRTPERAVQVLCRAVSRARVLKGTRGEADPTARLILDEHPGRGMPHRRARLRPALLRRRAARRRPDGHRPHGPAARLAARVSPGSRPRHRPGYQRV